MNQKENAFGDSQDNGTVSDRTMLSRAVTTLVSVLVILCAMAVTAYAYFGVSATSPSIPVTAARFQVEISISVADSVGSRNLISGEIAAKHTISLEAGKTYTLTLKPAGTAQGGFCSLTASGCDKTYYTQQLGTDVAVSGGKTKKIEFTVIPTANTVLTVDTSWGTSSFYGRVDQNDERYIFGGDSVTMIIAGAQLPVTENQETPTEPTVPVRQETTPAQQGEAAAEETTTPATAEPDATTEETNE